MKAIIILSLVVVLSGCATTVPVKPKFPESVPGLMEPCPELKQIPAEITKLSETISIVTKNYGSYHECSAKVNTWIEWYVEQKKIYDKIK
jgi:hypothetical protein